MAAPAARVPSKMGIIIRLSPVFAFVSAAEEIEPAVSEETAASLDDSSPERPDPYRFEIFMNPCECCCLMDMNLIKAAGIRGVREVTPRNDGRFRPASVQYEASS